MRAPATRGRRIAGTRGTGHLESDLHRTLSDPSRSASRWIDPTPTRWSDMTYLDFCEPYAWSSAYFEVVDEVCDYL